MLLLFSLGWAFVKFCVCPSFPFGREDRTWVVIVLIPDHCLFIYSGLKMSLYALSISRKK